MFKDVLFIGVGYCNEIRFWVGVLTKLRMEDNNLLIKSPFFFYLLYSV